MRPAILLAQRGCPAREACLARESLSRCPTLASAPSVATVPRPAATLERACESMPQQNAEEDYRTMTLRAVLDGLLAHEQLNFLLSNRIPRRALTRLMGWFSKIELPLIRTCSIALFRVFCTPDLAEAKKPTFKSLHDCFIRELKAGARPIDRAPSVLVSPCDGIVGASGSIRDATLLQIKGSPYTLHELVRDPELAGLYRHGTYVTLRLTAG